MRRQARGYLGTAAIRQHLARERRSPTTLPETSAELVGRWVRQHPNDSTPLLRHPLRRAAARYLAVERDWALAGDAPVPLGTWS